MKITWYKESSATMIVSINKNTIILNKPIMKMFQDYRFCKLGFDNDKSQIYIQPISDDILEQRTIEFDVFKVYTTRTYSRITNTSFINLISEVCNIAFSQNQRKFNASWDADNELLIVDLDSEVK